MSNGANADRLYAAIETGGTKILCRVVDGRGGVVADARFPTSTPERAVANIVDAVRAALGGSRLRGVGLASFGPMVLDPGAADYGRLLATSKAGWSGFDLPRALTEALSAPVVFDTDVNAAALAEHRLGAAQGVDVAAYVTVGTGIGGGLVVHGRTLKGALHPEVGHLRVLRAEGDGLIGACPFHTDCAESLASGPAIARRLGPGVALASRPDVLQLTAGYLGQLCETLVLAWSPQRIVLGGGVMQSAGLLERVHAALRERLDGYGPAGLVEAADFLRPPALEHSGLAGALEMARAAF